MTELDFKYLDYYHSKKAREEGKAEGKAEGKIEIARNMLAKGVDISLISECTGLSTDEVKALV